MKKKISKIFNYALTFLLVFTVISGFYRPQTNDTAVTVGAGFYASEADFDKGYETVSLNAAKEKSQFVYLGGMPLGLELNTRGLIIIGKTDVVTKEGFVNPTKNSDIQIGDLLLSINGTEVNTVEEMGAIINNENIKGKEVPCRVSRRNKFIDTVISSAEDINTKQYRTGLWVRQDSFGIGTLTFIKQDLRFAALGHPIIDSDTKEILPIKTGKVYTCTIAGCIKGERGKPGELKGMLIKEGGAIGRIDKNNAFGLFGNLNKLIKNETYPKLIETMPRTGVKPGKASIYTSLNGGQPQEYEIEIVKTAYQSRPADRSMVIKITDKNLLAATGGIVQGMSGSPILQNGKLCGAVTHVFVNDPTRGYGLYTDWMLNQ